MKVWPYVTVLLGANFFVARAASESARACFDQVWTHRRKLAHGRVPARVV